MFRKSQPTISLEIPFQLFREIPQAPSQAYRNAFKRRNEVVLNKRNNNNTAVDENNPM